MTIPTTERLARALEEKLDLPLPGLRDMIRKARDGYYDDFKSPIAMPCLQLYSDLQALGLGEMAARAANGEWDATKEESDAWAASPDGQAAIRAITGDRHAL